MPISKDDQYRIYNYGIDEGRKIVEAYLEDEDIIDVILEGFAPKTGRRFERSSLAELETAVRNFHDGIEDGINSQLGRECNAYVKWMRENL